MSKSQDTEDDAAASERADASESETINTALERMTNQPGLAPTALRERVSAMHALRLRRPHLVRVSPAAVWRVVNGIFHANVGGSRTAVVWFPIAADGSGDVREAHAQLRRAARRAGDDPDTPTVLDTAFPHFYDFFLFVLVAKRQADGWNAQAIDNFVRTQLATDAALRRRVSSLDAELRVVKAGDFEPSPDLSRRVTALANEIHALGAFSPVQPQQAPKRPRQDTSETAAPAASADAWTPWLNGA